MRGTFESEKTLHSFAPHTVPQPLAWGTYKDEPDGHFYMCDFFDPTDDLPDIFKFCAVVAQIHLDSMGKAPNGQFGFPVTTHLAALKRMLVEEEKSHGPDDELKVLTNAVFDNVIPRLLRPLETGGRHIKPCLVHSDLWPGNVKPDAETDEPTIFDSRYDLLHSALFPNEPKFRRAAMDEMKRLVSKYPEGYDGFAEQDSLIIDVD
ncbi:MAG: hypothetical protein Q9210_000535 [Variospora velana]